MCRDHSRRGGDRHSTVGGARAGVRDGCSDMAAEVKLQSRRPWRLTASHPPASLSRDSAVLLAAVIHGRWEAARSENAPLGCAAESG
jgi:hypothetical protein